MGFFDDIYCDMPLPDGLRAETRVANQVVRRSADGAIPYHCRRAVGNIRRAIQRPHAEGTFDCGYHGIINFYDYDHQPLRSEVRI